MGPATGTYVPCQRLDGEITAIFGDTSVKIICNRSFGELHLHELICQGERSKELVELSITTILLWPPTSNELEKK